MRFSALKLSLIFYLLKLSQTALEILEIIFGFLLQILGNSLYTQQWHSVVLWNNNFHIIFLQ
ncbi:hypothetical protein BBH99_05230 [Chryseobacterium contaminans]|uniref:Uncharacterized protein n=1 Tax=Chryseobacterium contaminans TaxID=1423959 RepID=A0ABX2X9F1_9FLAO|nr:hypothetical protein BBH99_05230 [Chryseobacterium contaminans]